MTPGKTDQLFALSTAQLDIEAKLDSPYGERAALVLRAVDNSSYDALQKEMNDLLSMNGRDFTAHVTAQTDNMGFHWLIFRGPNLEDAINGLHMAADLLKQAGYSDSLLAAMFRFGDWYLIYSYRRASFYPFMPTGSSRRNESREFRIRQTLDGALPIEKDPERWYPLWDPPI
nr:hypothetical protein [Sulfobacillus harzensis]